MYASILIDIKHEEINRFFDYVIPSSLKEDIKVGMRVVVPFGNQTRMGYVIRLLDKSNQATKEVIELLDLIPTIKPETFMLIDHILAHTNDLYSAIFETVVPAEIGLDYYQDIRLLKPDMIDKEFLSLFDSNGFLRLSKGNHTYDNLLRKYLRHEAISVTTSWRQKIQAKTIYIYRYNTHHDYQRASNYPVLKQLKNRGYQKSELKSLGLTDGHISTLLKHDVFMRKKARITREIKHVYDRKNRDIVLTSKQQHIFDRFYALSGDHKPVLLKGVTGSGKTELYLKWIDNVLKAGKQVMVFVPEIALIAPMAERLESAFEDVAVYHSHLSKGERFDQYMKIKRGEANIILGTRSAVFLPLDNIGLIIMDEEHDRSYQQTDHTPYDAREIALLRSTYHHCPIVFGSATPSIITMFKSQQNEYHLLSLDERPFGIKQPRIELVDMREELKQKNTTMFSKRLQNAINDRLEKKEQIMILFNRKGFAPFVMCRQCGDVPTCPDCGIALTYYQSEESLKCHYCGYKEPFHKSCNTCHHQTMKTVGVGIEQVEKECRKTFPDATIFRMDANVTKTKGAHEIIWHDFKHQKADILLGTQMIAKGLDFPNVTLVGVLMADLMLRTPSYRSSEDTFMLLTQVAGRSGRMHPGDVIIQGYDLDHFAIKDVLLGYDTFYKEALYERKICGYEPFNHVYQIKVEGKGYLETFQHAFSIKKQLLKDQHFNVLGPVPAYIKKKYDKFRFLMTIKSSTDDLENLFHIMDEFKHHDIYMRFYPIPDMI